LKNKYGQPPDFPDYQKSLIFLAFVGKNDLHIPIPAGFPWYGRGKPGGENHLDLRAIGG